MAFSEFLTSRRAAARALVTALQAHFAYVSVLGVDVKAKTIRVDRNTSGISNGRDTECGFVVKMSIHCHFSKEIFYMIVINGQGAQSVP